MGNSAPELVGVAISTHKHVKQAADELIKRGLSAKGTKYRELDIYALGFVGFLALSTDQRRLAEITLPVLAEFYDLTFYFWQLLCDDLISRINISLGNYGKVEQNRAKFLALKNAPSKEHYTNALSEQKLKLDSQKATPSKPADLIGEDWSIALTEMTTIFNNLAGLETDIDGWLSNCSPRPSQISVGSSG